VGLVGLSDFEWAALWMSLRVACGAVLLSTPVAVALATLMARTVWPGKWLLDALILLPMTLPPAVLGFFLVTGLGPSSGLGDGLHELVGWRLSFYPTGATLAATLVTMPLMARVLRPALEASDPMLLSVARTLGVSPWQGWWRITLPMLWPAVGSSMALGFAAAWGESGATLVLASALSQTNADGVTVPVALIQAAQRHRDGHAEAWRLAWASLGVSLAALLLSERARRRWRQPT
jgi:molybdate transport system permease protein